MYISNCRMCHSTDLFKFLDLGKMPPADQFLYSHELNSEKKYPLELMSCRSCSLTQLSYVVPGEELFCRDYPFDAGVTKTACLHWDEFAQSTSYRYKNDFVVDIGSNSGVLLQSFRRLGSQVLGIDPAKNIAVKAAEERGIQTVIDFFSKNLAKNLVPICGQASIITGTNVFAHIDDLDDFIEGIDLLLKPDGVLILESPHWMHLVRNFLYDTIYHEHLSYLSVKPMTRFFSKFGMEIVDIEKHENHGESFRYFVRRKGVSKPSKVVSEIIAKEEAFGIYDLDVLSGFAVTVYLKQGNLNKMVLDLKKRNKSIAAVSAPAKGMTLLNCCELNNSVIDFITEKTPLKIGRCTPGTHIPVVPDDVLFEKQPDYALLLAWNFSKEIMNNLKKFSQRGSKFIVPMPDPRIVN